TSDPAKRSALVQNLSVLPTTVPGAIVSLSTQAQSRSTALSGDRRKAVTAHGASSPCASGSGGSAMSGLEAIGCPSTVGSQTVNFSNALCGMTKSGNVSTSATDKWGPPAPKGRAAPGGVFDLRRLDLGGFSTSAGVSPQRRRVSP